jgi:hypothetical protein
MYTLASLLFFCNPKEEATPVKTPKKVLILGNSITWHPPGPDINWFGNWGMAASAADRDFLSLLIKKNYVYSLVCTSPNDSLCQ